MIYFKSHSIAFAKPNELSSGHINNNGKLVQTKTEIIKQYVYVQILELTQQFYNLSISFLNFILFSLSFSPIMEATNFLTGKD